MNKKTLKDFIVISTENPDQLSLIKEIEKLDWVEWVSSTLGDQVVIKIDQDLKKRDFQKDIESVLQQFKGAKIMEHNTEYPLTGKRDDTHCFRIYGSIREVNEVKRNIMKIEGISQVTTFPSIEMHVDIPLSENDQSAIEKVVNILTEMNLENTTAELYSGSSEEGVA